jgi:hypothetical protein
MSSGGLNEIAGKTQNQCGSELARDGGLSVTLMFFVPPKSRASSLPH